MQTATASVGTGLEDVELTGFDASTSVIRTERDLGCFVSHAMRIPQLRFDAEAPSSSGAQTFE